MSRTSNKSTMSKVIRSKSCKFCKDAGKSVEEYTSHFLRETTDPNSRIVCPTLLLIECRFCFKRGHTVSKCKKLADQKNGRNEKNVPEAPVKKAWTPSRKYVANTFDLLSEIGDSDNETEFESIGSSISACTERFAEPRSGIANHRFSGDSSLSFRKELSQENDCEEESNGSTNVLSYAQMLAKPVQNAQQVGVGSRLSILTKARMMRSWADSDSDSD